METPPKDDVTPELDPTGDKAAVQTPAPADQAKAARAQRLASALRQNLRRRKQAQPSVRPVDERN